MFRSLLLGRHPLAQRPRRVMPNMLPMSALQLRYPMPLLILVKPHNPSLDSALHLYTPDLAAALRYCQRLPFLQAIVALCFARVEVSSRPSVI